MVTGYESVKLKGYSIQVPLGEIILAKLRTGDIADKFSSSVRETGILATFMGNTNGHGLTILIQNAVNYPINAPDSYSPDSSQNGDRIKELALPRVSQLLVGISGISAHSNIQPDFLEKYNQINNYTRLFGAADQMLLQEYNDANIKGNILGIALLAHIMSVRMQEQRANAQFDYTQFKARL